MSAKKNKEAVRREIEEALNKGNLAVVDEIIADNYIHLGPGGKCKGPDGLRQVITMNRTTFPDIHATIEDIIAEGDRVAVRFTMRGTFKGERMGIAPTGRKIILAISLFIRFANGKEVEAFEFYDSRAFFQQLGITPPMGQGGG